MARFRGRTAGVGAPREQDSDFPLHSPTSGLPMIPTSRTRPGNDAGQIGRPTKSVPQDPSGDDSRLAPPLYGNSGHVSRGVTERPSTGIGPRLSRSAPPSCPVVRSGLSTDRAAQIDAPEARAQQEAVE